MRDVFAALQEHVPESALAFATHEETAANLEGALAHLPSTEAVVVLPLFLEWLRGEIDHPLGSTSLTHFLPLDRSSERDERISGLTMQLDDEAIRLYRSMDGLIVEVDGRYYGVQEADWDALFNAADLRGRLVRVAETVPEIKAPDPDRLLPPIESQEVWAAGVTYVRSKAARMTEAEAAGGGDFYDRVYVAARPELFFKATSHRVAGPGQAVRIRRDAHWNVPEPELALAVNAAGDIVGYTVGNDVSARDIEGENPLYLPQAKVYDQSCGLGPALLVPAGPLPVETGIRLRILRDGTTVFDDTTALTELKRDPDELVEYLFLDNSFPAGCFLLTGTGIVPPDAFTLREGDRIRITIDAIGTLENYVIQHRD